MMLLEENDQERTMLSMLNIIQKSLLQNFFSWIQKKSLIRTKGPEYETLL